MSRVPSLIPSNADFTSLVFTALLVDFDAPSLELTMPCLGFIDTASFVEVAYTMPTFVADNMAFQMTGIAQPLNHSSG